MSVPLNMKLTQEIAHIVLCCICAGVSPSYSQDLTITATVDQTVLGVGQPFTFTVEYSGSGANSAPEPELPDMNPFASYLGSAGTSSNFQLINGKMSISKSYSYRYLTTKAGSYEIPAITVIFKGKEFNSEPIDMQIVDSPQPAQSLPDRIIEQNRAEETIEGNLFVIASVDKRQVYQNEPIVVTYRILTRVEVTNFAITKMPSSAGFWMEEFPMPQRPVQRREVIDGREFVVADIKKVAFFPTTPGTKTLDPLGIDCEVRQPLPQRSSRSLFDTFFDDPLFGRMVRQTVYTEPISIEVLPLPEKGKPADFSGAVGSYKISASVDKTDTETNEAVTLTLNITGTGNVKMVSRLDVDIPSDLEQYHPKITEDISREGNTISGSKVFEYVLVPRFPGQHRIKPVNFSYFDLASKVYRTIATPEIVLNVRKASRDLISLGPGISKEEVKLVGRDIQFIKTQNLQLSQRGFPYHRAYFWGLLVLPVLAFVAAAVYRRHLDELAENVAYARRRKANSFAMHHLRRAKKSMTENTQKSFYAEISRALLGYLADKMNVSAAGLITDEVEKQLLARKVTPEKVNSFMECLRRCDYQRFAPATSTLQEMEELYENAKSSIVELEI